MKHFLAAVGLCLLAQASVAAAQVRTGEYGFESPEERVDGTSQATDIPFEDDGSDRMTVPVRLSGTGPYRFLVDTGADRSAVSWDIARRLGLERGARANLHSVTGVAEVGTATLPLLDLQARKVNNIEAALLDPGHIGADGILGLDSLRSQRILFDFKAQTLTVVPATDRVVSEKGTIVVTARRRNGRLIVTQASAEHTRITVVVDTGAEITIGNSALRKRLARSNQLRHSGMTELQSVTGEKLVGEYMYVKSLKVGDVTLKDLAVVFVDSHMFRQLNLEKKPAVLLGMNALRAFDKVSIDFERMKLRLVLPQESALQGTMFAAR